MQTNSGERKIEYEIISVKGDNDLKVVRHLFEEYAASLDFDLDFQDFKDELNGLPGEYAPPDGFILLALVDGQATGCVALRKFSDGISEMKRLYVKPEYRKLRIGSRLAEAVIACARSRGYAYMRLDTVPAMKPARALYAALGFKEIPPYRFNPIDGATYMERALKQPQVKGKQPCSLGSGPIG
mgnify:FL=1